ncbi:MAG: glycosyltransferase family 39 protein [Gammaproteobacteria bacterium]|nr:glycosyltransferase family 39 protein [Gammaproteobacteria bacterium]
MTSRSDQARLQWHILVVFVTLGLVARSLRYSLQFPLWEDEAFLFMNMVGRSYADFLEPLRQFHQVAPVMFLWVEKAVTDVFGTSELSLRLFPYLCSVASLLLFTDLARRLLSGWAAVLAVALLAMSYPALRYAAEMKPYGVDLFAAVLLLWMWERWAAGHFGWLWAMVAAVPALIWLSFPAVFVAGGVSLAIFATLLRERRQADGQRNALKLWFPWLVFNAVLVISFALSLFVLQRQFQWQGGYMATIWHNTFPPWEQPWKLPMWLLETHAGKFLAFPAGGKNFGSSLTLVLCVLGSIRVWRSDRRLAVFLLLFGPALLQLIAAGMHRYPYGESSKFAMPLAPAICLLAGAGAAWMAKVLSKKDRARQRIINFWLIFFLVVGVGSMARDVIRPYKTLSDERARGWAQWFWQDAPHRAVVIGMKSDLGLVFSPQTFQDLNWSAMYLANQQIYSSRHRRREPPDWSQVSAARPLWIVEYRDPQAFYYYEAYERWLEHLSLQFEIGQRMIFPMSRYRKNERDLIKVDEIHVLPLVPLRKAFKMEDLLLPE